jgi:hypothetical protein
MPVAIAHFSVTQARSSFKGVIRRKKHSEKAKKDGRDRKARPAEKAEGRLDKQKLPQSSEQAHGTWNRVHPFA